MTYPDEVPAGGVAGTGVQVTANASEECTLQASSSPHANVSHLHGPSVLDTPNIQFRLFKNCRTRLYRPIPPKDRLHQPRDSEVKR